MTQEEEEFTNAFINIISKDDHVSEKEDFSCQIEENMTYKKTQQQ